MKGQWVGRYQGTNAGLAVVDIDDVGDHFEAAACLFEDDQALPGVFAKFSIPRGVKQFAGTVPLFAINRPAAWLVPPKEVPNSYPGVAFPPTADITLGLGDRAISASWQTPLQTAGKGTLALRSAPVKSKYKPLQKVGSWAAFKRYVDTLDVNRYVFRGQSDVWPLRTAFHRTSRSDLGQFVNVDVPALSGRLTAVLDHFFDLSKEVGSIYSIAQHHGYPTPLLDWTRSPFIAAYFAFRNRDSTVAAAARKVRIFAFDMRQWRADFSQLDKVAFVPPHFSAIDLAPFKNSRFIPQQSVVTLTNVDDVEGYIRQIEKAHKKTYLQVIDLPYSNRDSALRNLAAMGIAAGALFPGLDGACEELKNIHFGF